MRLLFIGDLMGRPGRRIVSETLPGLVSRYSCDYVVMNGENAAGGRGITGEIARELFRLGADVITLGNHAWDQRETAAYIEREERLLRAYNYPEGARGNGFIVLQKRGGPELAVAQLQGRVFMTQIDCPFRAADRLLKELDARGVRSCVIDFHAEATSEKQALGQYLDGRVTAVLGTHTHVPTADEVVLPGGTAYITDVGMTGPYASVIGTKSKNILQKFLHATPVRHEPATGDVRLAAAVVDFDPATGKAQNLQRVRVDEDRNGRTEEYED